MKTIHIREYLIVVNSEDIVQVEISYIMSFCLIVHLGVPEMTLKGIPTVNSRITIPPGTLIGQGVYYIIIIPPTTKHCANFSFFFTFH